jgi:hypothetical protein
VKTQKWVSNEGYVIIAFSFLCFFKKGFITWLSCESILSIRQFIVERTIEWFQGIFNLLQFWCIFNFLKNSLLLLLSFKCNFKSLNCKLSLLCHRHIRSRGSKAFSELFWIITFHGHANPWKLHPNPSLIIIVCGRFLVKLKLFNNCFSIQILEIFKVLQLRFIFFNIFNFSDEIIWFSLLFRFLIILLLLVVKSHGMLFLSFKRNFFKETLYLIVIVFSKIVFIAFYFNI